MSRPPTYARSTDATHKDVVKAFRSAGCSVTAIQRPEAGLPDLLVGLAGRTHLVEVKKPTTRKDGRASPKSSLSEEQVEFANEWRGSPVHLVHDAKEAFELANLLRLTGSLRVLK